MKLIKIIIVIILTTILFISCTSQPTTEMMSKSEHEEQMVILNQKLNDLEDQVRDLQNATSENSENRMNYLEPVTTNNKVNTKKIVHCDTPLFTLPDENSHVITTLSKTHVNIIDKVKAADDEKWCFIKNVFSNSHFSGWIKETHLKDIVGRETQPPTNIHLSIKGFGHNLIGANLIDIEEYFGHNYNVVLDDSMGLATNIVYDGIIFEIDNINHKVKGVFIRGSSFELTLGLKPGDHFAESKNTCDNLYKAYITRYGSEVENEKQKYYEIGNNYLLRLNADKPIEDSSALLTQIDIFCKFLMD